MSDWPHAALPPLPVITAFSEEAWGMALGQVGVQAPQSLTCWFQHGSAEAMLFPFHLDVTRTVKKLFVMNGAVVTSNLDIGIYDDQFNLLVASGSTVSAGTDAVQEFDVTDTDIGPGDYWCAASCDDTLNLHLTQTAFGVTVSSADEEWFGAVAKYIGQNGYPLPSTNAVIKDNNISPRMPVYGLSFETVI